MATLLPKLPLVGGIQIFMVNPPVIDIDFTGLANAIDIFSSIPALKSKVASNATNPFENHPKECAKPH